LQIQPYAADLQRFPRGTTLPASSFLGKWTAEEKIMRSIAIVAVLAPILLLSACGSDDEGKTVVVNPPSTTAVQPAPPQNNTVVVPPSGTTKVCPSGQTVC
jgi:hypothetical protein